jgi:hypothetical protein
LRGDLGGCRPAAMAGLILPVVADNCRRAAYISGGLTAQRRRRVLVPF